MESLTDNIIEQLIYDLRKEENNRQRRIEKIKKYMGKRKLRVYFDVYWNTER